MSANFMVIGQSTSELWRSKLAETKKNQDLNISPPGTTVPGGLKHLQNIFKHLFIFNVATP